MALAGRDISGESLGLGDGGDILLLTIVSLAMVPAIVIGGRLDRLLISLLDNDHAIKSLASVQGIEFILLDDIDEFGGVTLVFGIPTIP